MAAAAWIAKAEGDADAAVVLMRAAADAEDLTEKSAISPGPIAPARELLGFLLLDLNRHAEALVAFETTTVKEPGRFRGIYGAGLAAELAGDRDKAATFYRQLLGICEHADADARTELTHAREFVGQG
jgi:hypothetical protein